MRFTSKMLAFLFTLMFIFFVTACQKENKAVQLKDAETQQALNDSSGDFINMWVGSTEAVITGGDSHALSAAPFAKDEDVYIPLKDVAAVFGGTVTPESDGGFTVAYDETVQGVRYNKNMTIRPGESQAIDNISGNQVDIVYMGSSAAPVIQGDIVFVPDFYFNFFLTQTYAQHDLGTGWITVSNFDDGRMLAGIKLEEDFDTLDDAVRSRFSSLGDPKTLVEGSLYETTYSDGNIELGVRTGDDIPDDMHTIIHAITLLTDSYATPRGLRVGDPLDRCYELYGYQPNDLGQVIAGLLKITEQGGIITGITIYAGS